MSDDFHFPLANSVKALSYEFTELNSCVLAPKHMACAVLGSSDNFEFMKGYKSELGLGLLNTWKIGRRAYKYSVYTYTYPNTP